MGYVTNYVHFFVTKSLRDKFIKSFKEQFFKHFHITNKHLTSNVIFHYNPATYTLKIHTALHH